MASQRRVHELYIFAALCFALTAGFRHAAIIVAAFKVEAQRCCVLTRRMAERFGPA